VTDDDCSAPSRGDGGGGATTTVYVVKKEYEIVLDMPSRLDINRGEIKTLRIGIKNTVENTELNNVNLSLSGYPQTFVSVSPYYLTGIGYGETKYFDVKIKAPIYAVYEEYDLNVAVNGEFLEANRTINANKSGEMLLVTHKFIENETLAYFERAREALQEINKSGFETKKISEMLEETEEALEEGNYDKVKELSENVINLKNLAFGLRSQIQETEKNIEIVKEQSFNLPETEKLLFLAKSAFQRGEYERAEERMRSMLLMYTIEMGSANFWIFTYNYWWLITIVIVVSGSIITIGRRRLVLGSLMKTLDSLVREEKKIHELIENLQKEHFVERKIGTENYYKNLESYENGLTEIKERRIDLLSRITRMLRIPEALKKLKEEEGRVKNLIIETQKSYFKLGKIGRKYYDKMMEDLKWELLEIQKVTEMLESEKNV